MPTVLPLTGMGEGLHLALNEHLSEYRVDE